MQKDLFYVILVGFVGGIFFRSFFDLGWSFSLFFILIGLVIFLYQYFQKNILTIGILLFFIGIGMLRLDIASFENNSILNNSIDKKISMTALVVDEPDVREDNTRIVIRFDDIDSKDKTILTINHFPEFQYGDRIKVIGILQKPKNFSSEGEREFDYVSYLKKDNIKYQMFYPRVEYISTGNGNFIKEKLFVIKNTFLKNVKKVIPEPHASLLGGLVVGAKESLGKELQEDFRKVGLIHIIVLSGYNLTIVADSIMKFFSFLSIRFATLFGAVGIILFAIMTGASATIVRASVMALLVMLARSTGRISDMTRILFLAGFFMLMHNPNILVFDPSFQLSFMATFGLITLSSKLEKYFYFLPTKFQLRETMTTTIATQIFVLPLLLYMMGDFSIVAILVNLLVLVFIPMTMLFGFLTGIIGFVSLIVSLPFAYLTYGLLVYELKIVDIFASLPFASFHIPYFPFWLMLVIYGIYLYTFCAIESKALCKNF